MKEDISAIIKKKIENFNVASSVEEQGYVLESGDGIVRIKGLPSAMSREIIEFANGVFGIAFNLEREEDQPYFKTQMSLVERLKLQFGDKNFFEFLLSIGITPKKSKTINDRNNLNLETYKHYDVLENEIKIINAENQNTIKTHNSMGQLLRINSPDFGNINYQYYDNGNLNNKVDNIINRKLLVNNDVK